MAARLAEARQHLSEGDAKNARELANSVVISSEATKQQKGHAHVLLGRIACEVDHDQSAAKTQLRKLDALGLPPVMHHRDRADLLHACREYPLDQ